MHSRLRGRLTARAGFGFQAAYDELNPADDNYRFYAALTASTGVSCDSGVSQPRNGSGRLARPVRSPGQRHGIR